MSIDELLSSNREDVSHHNYVHLLGNIKKFPYSAKDISNPLTENMIHQITTFNDDHY